MLNVLSKFISNVFLPKLPPKGKFWGVLINDQYFSSMNIRLILLAICLLGMACNEANIDITAPTLKVKSINPTPMSGWICGAMEDSVIYIKSTDSLVMNLLFSDDEQLSQYKIDIHNNFDCHGHRGPSTNTWNLQKIIELEGTEKAVREVLLVPNDVTAGNYHCSVLLLDESGNQASTTHYSLSMQNQTDTIPPSVVMTHPNSSSLSLQKGATLNVQGTLTDNHDLEHGRMELIYFTPSGNKSTAKTISIDQTAGNNYPYQFNYTIPNSFAAGTYDFEVRAYDGVGNIGNVLTFSVVVS